MEVVVGLNFGQISANPFIVDLVLGVGKKDKGSNDTSTTAALDPGADLAVPNVVIVTKQRAGALLRHRKDKVSVFQLRLSAIHPVGRGSVSEVLAVLGGVVQIVPLVGLTLTNGHRGAGIKRV